MNSLAQARAVFSGAARLVITLAFAPWGVLSADKDTYEDRAEGRINQMHAKQRITSAQKAR